MHINFVGKDGNVILYHYFSKDIVPQIGWIVNINDASYTVTSVELNVCCDNYTSGDATKYTVHLNNLCLLTPGGSMLRKEIIEAGEQIASDLLDAQISKDMGNLGGHIIKDISEYRNSDLVQKYLDGEIVNVEAIFTAMKRAEVDLKEGYYPIYPKRCENEGQN